MAVTIKKGTPLGFLTIMPLLDVIFLLLIFFMVVSEFAREDRELKVLLPAASEAKPMTLKPREVFINIDKEGRYYVKGEYRSATEVEDVLKQAATDNPMNQSVVIRADRRVELRHAVVVMNTCNRVGIFDYSLTIEGGDGG